jgi:hypothetical protein
MSNKPGRCAVNRITIIVVIFAALTLSGCVVLPIPWPANSPRYSPETLAKIEELHSSRWDVGVLGKPDIERLGGRYWVYHWKVESGKWFAVPLLPPVNGGMPMGNMGPIVSKQFILFLEFDEKDILLSKQFGEKTGNKYCTTRGLCLEHEVATLRGSGHAVYAFHNMESGVTISGSSKASVPWPTVGGDRCVVVLWPDVRDWKDEQGLRLDVGDPPEVLPSWLPVGSYLESSLPAGWQTVRANPYVDNGLNPYAVSSMENFQCDTGRTVYIEIGKFIKKWTDPSTGRSHMAASIVLRTIDPETGFRVIADMPRLLPPPKD